MTIALPDLDHLDFDASHVLCQVRLDVRWYRHHDNLKQHCADVLAVMSCGHRASSCISAVMYRQVDDVGATCLVCGERVAVREYEIMR